MHTVYLLLGSNLGERRTLIHAASMQIGLKVGSILAQSAIYETVPWGVTDQPPYLNQVLQVTTRLKPEAVLDIVLHIEEALGRIRHEKWGARLIDIDILFYDDIILHTERLRIPHPLLHVRQFVLFPLSEIAPKLRHPERHETVEEMLAKLPQEKSAIKKIC